MERCDFASVIAVIRADLLEDSLGNQTDFVEDLFGSYLAETETVFDMGLVSKWLNGLAKPSPAIGSFYQKRSHRKDLEITFLDVILPNLSDSAMVVQNVYALLLGDVSISESKKAELCEKYPCETKEQEAAFLADVLLFGLTRPFVKRDIRKPQLPPAGSLSPVLADYIIDDGLPKPCPYFCGREKELAELHAALIEHDKVFLNGIPGIGKSEIAKAYAKEHRKEYTNILYIPYTGDLKADIVSLIFADDLPEEDMETRFRKHIQAYIFFPVDILHVRPYILRAFRLDSCIQTADIGIGLFHVFVTHVPVDGLAKTESFNLSVDADGPATQPQRLKIHKGFLQCANLPEDAGVSIHPGFTPLFPKIQAFGEIFRIDHFKYVIRVLPFKSIVMVFLAMVTTASQRRQVLLQIHIIPAVTGFPVFFLTLQAA